ERIRRHAAEDVAALLYHLGLVAVLEVAAAHALDEWRGRQQHRGGCPLLRGLEPDAALPARSLHVLPAANMPLQVRRDPARHERVRNDALAAPAPRGLHCEQDVRGLRLAVC